MLSLLISIAIVGLIVGVVLYVAGPYIPAVFQRLIVGIAVIICLVWLLQALGFWTGFPRLR